MKKVVSFILTLGLVFSLAGCGSEGTTNSSGKDVTGISNTIPDCTPDTDTPVLLSTGDVTVDKVIELTTPGKMIEANGPFEFVCTYSDTGDDYLEGVSITIRIVKNNDEYEINENMDYTDGYSVKIYIPGKSDSNYYVMSDFGAEKYAKDDDEDNMAAESVFGYTTDRINIVSVSQENDCYVANIELADEGEVVANELLYLDAQTGKIIKMEETDYIYSYDDEGNKTEEEAKERHVTFVFTYDSSITIDTSARDAVLGTTGEEGGEVSEDGDLVFSTVDIYGNTVTNEMIKGAKVVLLNLWEPWCGPCVGEMPDLQKLYEKYKDKGLLIIGAYTTFEMDGDAEDIIDEYGIKYPIIKADDNIMAYEQDYVPATFVFDGNGKLLMDEPIAGSQSYSEWEKLILQYLGE